jgi:hypothetical protein
MAFRTPTPLNSTDLQFGHCVENIVFHSLVPTRQFSPHCQYRESCYLGMPAWTCLHWRRWHGPGPDGWLLARP